MRDPCARGSTCTCTAYARTRVCGRTVAERSASAQREAPGCRVTAQTVAQRRARPGPGPRRLRPRPAPAMAAGGRPSVPSAPLKAEERFPAGATFPSAQAASPARPPTLCGLAPAARGAPRRPGRAGTHPACSASWDGPRRVWSEPPGTAAGPGAQRWPPAWGQTCPAGRVSAPQPGSSLPPLRCRPPRPRLENSRTLQG